VIPLRVLGDRILVQPDEDLNAPEQLASGIHVAKTLSAAVTGTDKTFSVQRGTVLAVGTPRHPRKEEAESAARLGWISSNARWPNSKRKSECRRIRVSWVVRCCAISSAANPP
jgi:co-chaperonin GroES (HSP10)